MRGTGRETGKRKKMGEQGGVQKKEEKAQIMAQRSQSHLLTKAIADRNKRTTQTERAQNAKFLADTELHTPQAQKHDNVMRNQKYIHHYKMHEDLNTA